ncbi:MAG: NAD-dependent epimerase/dehydratase family protein [Solirubrobacteraceae bacterium]
MLNGQRLALVTGAGGFIATALRRRLAGEGYLVRGLDLPSVASSRPSHELIGCDVTKPLPPELLADVDLVIHGAALAGVQPSWSRPADYWRTNAFATRVVRAACEVGGSARVVHLSSSSVYGHGLHLEESGPRRPLSPYGLSKLAAEEAWVDYPAVVTCRLSNVYGPGQRDDMAYATFIRAALSGGQIRLRDGGRQLRTPTYIDDCIEGIMLAATRATDGAVYNIAGPEDVRLADVPRHLARLLRAPIHSMCVPPGRGDPRVATVSIDRARRELGYAPATRLRDGLARQLAAAQLDLSQLMRVADA